MAVLSDLAKATVALFIIIDPIGLIPTFLGLTSSFTVRERKRVFTKALLVAFLLLVLFSLGGNQILYLFRITIDDFKIAGGILLLVIALQSIFQPHTEGQTTGSVGVVPLAVPLLAGPGALTTSIVFIKSYGLWVTLGGISITFLISYVIYSYVGVLYKLIGKTGADVVARLMGMLLAAIAVQFIRQGIIGIIRHY